MSTLKNSIIDPLKYIRWFFIAVFFIVNILSNYYTTGTPQLIMPIASVIALFMAAFLHGIQRYGFRNMVIFFLLTWLVSHFFEALSIQIGFPFSQYYYDRLGGPRLFQVPLIIMFAYFGTGYAAWILANIILGQYYKRIRGMQKFFLPLIATFIMVMWDLVIDPIMSTIATFWVWPHGGIYFGVPLQNYFGWFLVVFIIFQAFTLYIPNNDDYDANQLATFKQKYFWLEAIALYAIQSLPQLLSPFFISQHYEVYGPMALITVFTMVFVSVLAYVRLTETDFHN